MRVGGAAIIQLNPSTCSRMRSRRTPIVPVTTDISHRYIAAKLIRSGDYTQPSAWCEAWPSAHALAHLEDEQSALKMPPVPRGAPSPRHRTEMGIRLALGASPGGVTSVALWRT